MKKLMKFACLGVASLGLLLSGCSEEQSSLNIGDIQTFTTIVGSVSFSTGQVISGGNFVEREGNPAGKTVFVEVPNNALVDRSAATGNTTFTTTVDGNGMFEIEIPLASTSAEARIFVEPIRGTFSEFVTLNLAGVEQFREVPALFRVSPRPVVLQRNNATVKNLTLTHQDIERDLQFETTVTMIGGAGRADQTALNTFIYRLTGGLRIILEVTYFTPGGSPILDANGNYVVRRFGTATDAQGEWSLTIPAFGDGYRYRITKSGIPFTGNYSHFFSFADPNARRMISGVFNAGQQGPFNTAGVVYGIPLRFADWTWLRYNFTPNPGQIVAGERSFPALWNWDNAQFLQ